MDVDPVEDWCYFIWGYRKVRVLGSGTFGTVYECVRMDNGYKIAIKECAERHIPQVYKEIDLLKTLSGHRNVVQVLDWDNHPRFMVLELLDTSLKAYMKMHYPAQQDRVRRMMGQILNGLSFIHEKNIIHCDLKPENMLIDLKRDVLKIADFGLAMRWSGKGFAHICCTIPYRPPDVQFGVAEYAFDVDLWSVGCVFAELARSGRRLFPIYSQAEMLGIVWEALGMKGIARHLHNKAFIKPRGEYKPLTYDQITNWDSILPNTPASAKSLFLALIQFNPKMRLPARHALEHQYFRDDPNAMHPTLVTPSSMIPPFPGFTSQMPNNAPTPFRAPLVACDSRCQALGVAPTLPFHGIDPGLDMYGYPLPLPGFTSQLPKNPPTPYAYDVPFLAYDPRRSEAPGVAPTPPFHGIDPTLNMYGHHPLPFPGYTSQMPNDPPTPYDASSVTYDSRFEELGVAPTPPLHGIDPKLDMHGHPLPLQYEKRAQDGFEFTMPPSDFIPGQPWSKAGERGAMNRD